MAGTGIDLPNVRTIPCSAVLSMVLDWHGAWLRFGLGATEPTLLPSAGFRHNQCLHRSPHGGLGTAS